MTFSVVVTVPGVGLLGAATASRSLGVGNAVPAVWPGVGAVVSQSWTNRSLRGRVLDALARGSGPETALASVADLDPGFALRQVGVVTADGRCAVHTGADCSPWAGSLPIGGADGGPVGVVCGNLLVDESTLGAVADVVGAARPAGAMVLAAALVTALRAGQRAGGDVRGEQSAAVLVGSGAAQGWQPPDLDVDLRVDDHVRPLEELDRLVAMITPRSVSPPRGRP